MYIYCFRYRNLINWVDEVRKKHPGRFKSTATIQAVAGYNRATKREEILIDVHSIKDINAIDRLLDAWHSKKKKGLKVKVTATLLELPQALNSLDL